MPSQEPCKVIDRCQHKRDQPGHPVESAKSFKQQACVQIDAEAQEYSRPETYRKV